MHTSLKKPKPKKTKKPDTNAVKKTKKKTVTKAKTKAVNGKNFAKLNKLQMNAAKKMLERQQQHDHLAPFIRRVFETVDPGAVYMHAWYIDLIAEYLEAIHYDEITNLAINIPPRFLKSIAVTIAFPAWELGLNPSQQIIGASYSEKLSMKHNVDCRLVVQSNWYHQVFPEVQLAGDQNEKAKFTTTKRGHRIATSVGGTATGEGGNILILDDPINPKKALSDTERAATNDWVDQTWSTRKNNPKRSHEIIVMQRLHVNDTTGHVLGKDPDKWEHLVLPQEATKKTIIIFPRTKRKVTRKKGDLLHPERMGKPEIAGTKKRLGSYGFAGQHQQRPTPLGGGRIKLSWFPRFKSKPLKEDVLQTMFSCDTAQKDTELNDPSAIGVFQKVEAQWYLVHIWKDTVRYPDLKKKVYEMNEFWKPHGVLIEDKSSGESLIQELRQGETGKANIPVIAITPEASKIVRLDTQTPTIEAGILALPDPNELQYEWLQYLEECLAHFPSPSSWDELDMISQFLKYIHQGNSHAYNVIPFSKTSKSHYVGRV